MLRKFLPARMCQRPKKLYKYLSADGAEKLFNDPSLWFCLPGRLNDIYDLNPVGSYPAKWGGYAVLCLSGTPTSVPMWSHYGSEGNSKEWQEVSGKRIAGNGGNGMVLEFSVQSDFFRKYPPKKISYRSKRPTIKNVEKALMTKDVVWSYEREWRCITSIDFDEHKEQTFLENHHAVSVPFPFEALTAVIYGYESRVDYKTVQTFLARPEASHVQQLVCRPNAWRYGLKICILDDVSHISAQCAAVDWARGLTK